MSFATPHGPLPLPTLEGRYRLENQLGRGAMGVVYRAHDTTLDRPVALKLIAARDPEVERRFLIEARSQARIDHPNVCKVYEAGKLGDRLFIAMQLIEGRTLREAAAAMTLEEKVAVMADVADAAHEAHRLGILHRDLKPSNILIERREDGALHPYVTDFGIARDLASPGETATGAIFGTPQYMAPEQARGQVHALDRRTDVYALGATLYEVLAGRPPSQGGTAVQVLYRVLHDEPVTLRSLDRALPADLEVIAARCLEKDPRRRYDSAKALAADLRRHLDGEPILARPPTLGERARKVLKRNKPAAAALAVAAVLGVVFGVLTLRAQLQARRQLALAQRFGRETAEVESLLRTAAMLPLHDIKREKAVVRERMAATLADLDRLGAIGEGPGQLALGRAHLALGETDLALARLERSRASGYRAPELSAALGAALGELYRKALAEVNGIANKELRAARKQQLERALRDPALQHLREAGAAGAPLSGLFALIEGKYAEAIASAGSAWAAAPWDYSAKALAGRARNLEAMERRVMGDLDGAEKELQEAGADLAVALEAGRSDAAVLEEECQRRRGLVTLGSDRGRLTAELGQGAIDACARASAADSERPGPWQAATAVRLNIADDRGRHGQDASELIEAAIASAERAIALGAEERSLFVLGSAQWRKASALAARGRDPQAPAAEAVRAYERAIELAPGMIEAFANLAAVHGERAAWLQAHGGDALPEAQRAAETLERALQLSPRLGVLHSNLGATWLVIADIEQSRGGEVSTPIARAVAGFHAALESNPRSFFALLNLANAQLLLADDLLEHGQDPGGALEECRSAVAKASPIAPSFAQPSRALGACEKAAARYQFARGDDPGALAGRAAAAFERALEKKPDYVSALNGLGATRLLQARSLLARDQPAAPLLAEARAPLAKAAAIDPSDAEVASTQGEVELLAAQAELRERRSPAGAFAAALAAFTRAVRSNERDAGARASLAELHRRRAEWLVAAGREATAELEAGLAAAEQALKLRHQLSAALAEQGRLRLLQARLAAAAERGRHAAAAGESLRAAAQVNPLLAPQLRPALEQALSWR